MFSHGDTVTLFDCRGVGHTGTLHAPDEDYTHFQRVPGYSKPVPRTVHIPQSVSGSYGVYTIITPGGRRFRTEGRLYAA